MMNIASGKIVGGILFSLALAVLGLTFYQSESPPARFRGTELIPSRDAPEFSALNWDGSMFQLGNYQGKVLLLAFGYTFCPDVCPFVLRRLASMHEQLGDDEAEETLVVFISVDPERDTIEKIKSYIPVFNGSFYGLRPEEEEIGALLEGYQIKVTKQTPRTGGGYDEVDHTGDVFLIGKGGQVRLTHPHDTTSEDLLADVQELLRE